MCLLPLAPITKKLLVVVPPRLQSTVVALHYIDVETAEFVPLLFGYVTDGFPAHVVVVHVGVVVVHVGVLLPNPRPAHPREQVGHGVDATPSAGSEASVSGAIRAPPAPAAHARRAPCQAAPMLA